MSHSAFDLRCEYCKNPLAIAVESPRLSWKIASESKNIVQEAYQIQVATSPELLEVRTPNLWDSGEVLSNQCLDIPYGGDRLHSTDQAFWAVRVRVQGKWSDWSSVSFWECAIVDRNRWHSQWISFPFEGDWTQSQPAQLLRHEFELPPNKIYRARLYFSAKGLIVPFLNGLRATESKFLPGWTDYSHRIPYETLDVTSYLRPGINSVGALVGDGWYCGQVCWFGRNQYGNYPMGLLRLSIEFEDREPILIGSDSTWRAAESAIRSSDLIQGETFDGSFPFLETLLPGFDDSNWRFARAANLGQVQIVPRVSPPCEVIEELEPVKVWDIAPGKRIYDFGQNLAGSVEILTGAAVQKLSIRHGETLDQDGNLYVENLRSARATDEVCNLSAGIKWSPEFTFHGYRYAEITSAEPTGLPEKVVSRAIHTNLERTGHFSCSDPLLNRLYENALWSQKGNFVDVSTDCPQRDERLGWTGDAQVFASTAAYNFDVCSFFENWMADVNLGATETGFFPNIAPNLLELGQGAPGWADAGILVPFTLYKHYGNHQFLAKCKPSMTRYIDTILSKNPDGIWRNARSHDFGDWLCLGEETDKTLIATAFLINGLRLLGIRLGLGNYLHDWRNSMEAFEAEFFESGLLKQETQTAYALILAFRIGHPRNWKKYASRLAALIQDNGVQIATGFLGVNHLLDVLSEFGYFDLCYQLLMRKEYPSWLFPVTQGATTIWERWDGWTEEKGFQDVGMNSFNHYAYGSVVQWLYEHIGGISPGEQESGFQELQLAPTPGGNLAWANVRYESRFGTIRSEWKYGLDGFRWEIEIPPNTVCKVVCPPISGTKGWRLDGSPIRMRTVEFGGEKRQTFQCGSGKYELSTY